MREIVLDSEFYRKIQRITPNRTIPGIPNVVMALARALDELPVDIAEEVIYHSLVTSSLGGKQLYQEPLVLSLLELCRIRGEKGDGFYGLPTARWSALHTTPEYQAVSKNVCCPLEMGLVLHTISRYLREHSSIKEMHNVTMEMLKFKNDVEWLLKENDDEETLNKTIDKKFQRELSYICSAYVNRAEYLQAFPYECENIGEFEIAFANLFIMMANTRAYML